MEIGIGGFGLRTVRRSGEYLSDLDAGSPLESNNILRLDLNGAESKEVAAYLDGGVVKIKCFTRDGRVLPVRGQVGLLLELLAREPRMPAIIQQLQALERQHPTHPVWEDMRAAGADTLEAMIRDGWIKASYDPGLPLVRLDSSRGFQRNRDR